MKGLNVVVISGNVSKFDFSTTKTRGDDVCTFVLAIERGVNEVTWTRVNVYGGPVSICRRKMARGAKVEVEGELMNRFCNKVQDSVLEIRCKDIKFIDD